MIADEVHRLGGHVSIPSASGRSRSPWKDATYTKGIGRGFNPLGVGAESVTLRLPNRLADKRLGAGFP